MNICPEPSPITNLKSEIYGNNNTYDNTRNNASVFDFRNINERSKAKNITGTGDVLRPTEVIQNNSLSPAYG